MTEDEIKQLAFDVATRLYKHFGDNKVIELMEGEYIDVIKIILENYGIHRKKK